MTNTRQRSAFKKYLPILDWSQTYSRDTAVSDGVAALIVTIMLIPQSLAYALLAGLPPEMGLYASILPLIAYAIFGTSRTLAVGPVAVVSLMTAAAISNLEITNAADYAIAAISLAFLSGAMLLLMGVLRLGQIANFLSHPVIAGFITASGILIAVSQLRHILGIDASGHNLIETASELIAHLGQINFPTVVIGVASLAFLFWVRKGLKPLLQRLGLKERLADLLAKAGPIAAVAVTTIVTWLLNLEDFGVSIVGSVPTGLPPLSAPSFDVGLLGDLLVPALLISIIGFVESVSVAQTLAAKRRQRIDPDQELIALGASNIAAGASGGYPVTGGFARSVVNFDAGAETPAAGAYTAIGLAIAALFLTPLLYFLPKATLAATIIVAVLSLIDLSILKRAWGYSKVDFIAVSATILATLAFGVETGVLSGVAASVGLHLYKTSRPHVAEVGLVPGTQHFRNILRHNVETFENTIVLRVDESLYFANARFLEDYIQERLQNEPQPEHLVLMFPAVNEVDMSALETLESINETLKIRGIKLHLSEVKGPVMDRLKRSHFLDDLTGKVFLSQWDAWRELTSKHVPQSA